MFDKDFYPTPVEVIEQMGLRPSGKVCYEPQGGKGDIVDWLQLNGAKKVIASERNPELNTILQSKCQVIGTDFLKVTAEQIAHVDMIVMNPPFSAYKAHIQHAWNIAPNHCEIISLLNYDSWKYLDGHDEVFCIARDNGYVTELGAVFSSAERKTQVNVGVLTIQKQSFDEGMNFDGFYMDEDVVPGDASGGLMPFNAIRALVQKYCAALQRFDKVIEAQDMMNEMTREFAPHNQGVKFHFSYNEAVSSKEDFTRTLQKNAWEYAFGLMDISQFVTSGVQKEINKFVENQSKVPFTMKNIYRMAEIIYGTRGNSLKKSLIEAVDNFTKHTHENRYGVEGWKTNAGHCLNKKFIVNYMVQEGFRTNGTLSLRWSGYRRGYLDDLCKVMCNLTATKFTETFESEDGQGTYYRSLDLRTCFEQHGEYLERNKWYTWGFFEFKLFKKGTMHLKFRDLKQWEILNRSYAEAMGQVLPEKI